MYIVLPGSFKDSILNDSLMALDQVIPLTTKEGHQYLIEFFITSELILLPESIDAKIANVAITLVSGAGMNNASTLFQISGIMKEYLNQNDIYGYVK